MTIREAQQTIDQWITTTGVRYFNELTNMAMLTEEVGEVVLRSLTPHSFLEAKITAFAVYPSPGMPHSQPQRPKAGH
jgi:hypothetical protein